MFLDTIAKSVKQNSSASFLCLCAYLYRIKKMYLIILFIRTNIAHLRYKKLSCIIKCYKAPVSLIINVEWQ